MFSPSPSSYQSSNMGSRAQSSPFFDPFGIVGPLGNNYCLYFYIVAILAFITFLIALTKLIHELVTSKTSTTHVTTYALAMTFIAYLQARILFNMCLNSL